MKEQGFFRSHRGKKSMISLLAFCGIILAALCVLEGLGLAAYETITKTGTANGVTMVTIGFGIFTGAGLTKAWQGSAEAKAYGVSAQAVLGGPDKPAQGNQ